MNFPLSAPVNLRDLGGIPVRGGTIRPGFVVRTDDLSVADHDTCTQLVHNGLAAIIDLRTPAEVSNSGRGPMSAFPVSYHHLAMFGSLEDAARVPDSQAAFANLYIQMFEQGAPRIVQSLAVIAASPGTAAFHCAAGQDRTGVLAAALLLVLGADRDAIVSDYLRTGENRAAIMERISPMLTALSDTLGLNISGAATASARETFSPAPMEGLLDHLDRTYSDPLTRLRQAGLTPSLSEALCRRATVPAR